MLGLTGAALLLVSFLAAPVDPVASAVASFRLDPSTSARRLIEAAELAKGRRSPGARTLSSALTLLAAEAQLAAGARARARTLATTVKDAEPRLASRAAFVVARAALPKDCEASLGALDFIASRPVDGEWLPEERLLETRLEAETICKRPAAGLTSRRLALEFPATAVGRLASNGVSFTTGERLQRAETLEKARDYAAAKSELLGLLESESADEARFRLARLELDRLRLDFAGAARLFAEVARAQGGRAPEARYLRARALFRSGDVAAAAAAYEAVIAESPPSPHSGDATFFRAFLEYEAERYTGASERFVRITDGAWAEPSQWYAAFSLYLAKKPEAQAALDALAKSAPGPERRRRAEYWAARALSLTDAVAGRRRLLSLADEAPLSWYGLLVRRAYPQSVRGLKALPTSRSTLTLPRGIGGFERVVDEVRLLAAAGLQDFARRILADAREELRRRKAHEIQSVLSSWAGDYALLSRTTHANFAGVLADEPTRDQASVWQRAYPLAYEPALRAHARAGLNRLHLASFMLKESGYDPSAISPAHAIGLLQLMPRTAEAILLARAAGVGSSVDEDAPAGVQTGPQNLFNPLVNIELGGWYLAALSERFGGQLPLIAAAYNAGPPSVVSWFRGRPSVETDVFVENIPFRETREYVKRLSEFYVVYGVVHGGESLERASKVVPTSLDLTVRPGVDF